MKNRTKYLLFYSLIFLIGVLLVGVCSYLITLNKSLGLNYAYDSQNSIIKIEITNPTFLGKFFRQQTSFDPYGNVEINTPVKLRNYVQISPTSNPVGALKIVLLKDGGSYKEIITSLNPNVQPGNYLNVDLDWTPTEAGTYTTETYIKCTTAQCNLSGSTWNRWVDPLESQSSGKLTVIDSTPVTCDKSNYCGGYELDTGNTVQNGKVEKRNCYVIGPAPDCLETVDRTEYKTTCNSGYKIVGSTSTSANEIKNCELIVTTTPTCVENASLCISPQICDTTSKTCVDPGCTADVYQNCTNGTVIKTYTCINNVANSTGITCPASNSTNNQNNNSGSNQTSNTTSTICWKDSRIKEQAIIGSDNTCDSVTITGNVSCTARDMYDTKSSCETAINSHIDYILYGTIGGVIIFILVLITILYFKFKK